MSLGVALKAWRGPTTWLRAAGMVLMFAGLVAACDAPQPESRTYFDFMEDGIAREGVLARCNHDRDATLNDQECVNARRAAVAIGLEKERARDDTFARESQRKLTALRDRAAREQLAEEEAEAAARAEAKSAYERLWRKPAGQGGPTADDATQEAAPAFGAPLGALLPSLSDSDSPEFDGQAPSPPRFSAAPPEAPANDVQVVPPEVRHEDIALAPEHLRAAAN